MPQIDFLPANPTQDQRKITLFTLPNNTLGPPEVYIGFTDQYGRYETYNPQCSTDISDKLRLAINEVLSVPKGWHLVRGEQAPSSDTHFAGTNAFTPPPTFHSQEGARTLLKFPDEYPFYVSADWKLVLVK